MRPILPLIPTLSLLLTTLGCERPKTYETNVELVAVQRFGDGKAPGLMDLELRFGECGGDVRRVIRLDKAFSQCAPRLKVGDKMPVTMTMSWNSEKGSYRSDVVKIGTCPVKADPQEAANYELVQVCTDLQSTGAVVGVRCDRSRPKELIDKCPFLRRK